MSALELLEQKHALRSPKTDVSTERAQFSTEQIDEATTAIAGLRSLMKCTSIDQVPMDQRKALSAFNVGAAGFLLAPEMSSQVLSCIEEPSDISGMMSNLAITGPSVKLTVDNGEIEAAWACNSQCFANNPTQQLADVWVRSRLSRKACAMSRAFLAICSKTVA